MNIHRAEVPTRYADRRHAGTVLAAHLAMYEGREDLLVLALPRGGVPVAYEVARALRSPLDVLVVRKLGAPRHPEFAIGAVAGGGITVLDDAFITAQRIPTRVLEDIVEHERAEVRRRERAYRANRPPIAVRGAVTIVVDDGLATGATMQAAVKALRQQGAAGIVVAVPVGSRQACEVLAEVADQVICPLIPEPFSAVGQWYENFSETSDDEVCQILTQATAGSSAERSA
jgi:predicted phosphoribosyltransferase